MADPKPLRYGVPKVVDGVRNPEYWRRQSAATRDLPRKRQYDAVWRQQNSELCAEYTRRYREKRKQRDPEEFRLWVRDSGRRWRTANPEKHQLVVRKSNLRRNFGITLDDYYKLLQRQKNRCAICLVVHLEEKGKRLHVDHCHDSGKIRGLLCGACNSLLGYARNDPKTLQAAVRYLKNA